VFSSTAFCRAWAETYGMGWQPVPGEGDLGVVYRRSRRLGLRDYELGPRGLYWGAEGGAERSAAVVLKLARRWSTLGLTLNCRYDARAQLDLARAALGPARTVVTEAYTHVLSIEGRSHAEVFARLKPVTRWQVRRAERAGLRVVPLVSAEDLERHERLLRAWAAGKGVSPEPRRLFEALLRELGERVVLLGAVDGEQLVATVLVFRDATEWFYWHGARDAAADRHFATDLLLSEILRQACEHRVRYFNLGASNGIASLEAFKERWGGERRAVWSLRALSPWKRSLVVAWARLRAAGAGGSSGAG